MAKKVKLYIARDEGEYKREVDDEHNGQLHLFYDKPLTEFDPLTWKRKFGFARCICEVPSYMYPFIKDGQCYELSSIIRSDSEENELPIDTPCMVCCCPADICDWRIAFYAGNGRVWTEGCKSDSSDGFTHSWPYLIPWNKFDPNDIAGSLKYNLVKHEINTKIELI